jgi:lysozyme
LDLKFIVVGDTNSSGGVVLAGSSQHLIQGQGIARLGDAVDCPARYPDGRPHGVNPIVQGDETCLIDARPVALHGFKSACGCTLVGRVTVTRTLGRMVARGAPSPSAVESNPLVVSSATASDTTPTPKQVAQGRINTTPGSVVVVQDARLAKPWRISEAGMRFIAIWESGLVSGHFQGNEVVDGFILRVYDDGYGIPTVGMGHRVQPEDRLNVGDKISLDQAKSFMTRDLQVIEHAIHRYFKVPLFQHEYDALLSVLMNTGPNRRVSDPWRGSRAEYLANILLTQGYDVMPEVIQNFLSTRVKARRSSEAKLFQTGIYDAHH